jgi:uncharacterized membrane protein YjfL (UPF0719 family)
LLWVGKKFFDLFTSFSLEVELVKADNKAIAIAFTGYLAGVATILEGVLEGSHQSLIIELLEISVWGVVGILLLNLAGKMNDRFILSRINNSRELSENKNISVGVAVAGSYMGSAMIIRGIVIGESIGWIYEISLTLFYFFLAQFSFFLYSHLHQKITQYDFLQEIREGNVAAGVSFAFNLLAMGILLSIPIQESYSLVYYAVWFLLGASMIAFFRFVMDRMIIPMEKLDEEIHKDKNWGAAFLEGCFSVSAVIMLQAIFGGII